MFAVDYWSFFITLVISGALAFLTLGTWTLVVALVLLPRLRQQAKAPGPGDTYYVNPGIHHEVLTRSQPDVSAPIPKVPAMPAEWDRFREWAIDQPGTTIPRAEIIGMIEELYRQADATHNGRTSLIAFPKSEVPT